MATETTTSASEWNVNTLKEYFNTTLNDYKSKVSDLRDSDDLRYQQRFDAQQKAVVDALLAAEKAVNAALASADRAVVKAETAAEKRFESVNEFRSVLSNQSSTLMPRTESDAQMKALNDKIEVINGRLDRNEGGDKAHSSSQATIIAVAAVVVALLVGIFSVFNQHGGSAGILTPAVADNTKRVDDLIARLDFIQRSLPVSPPPGK
jgi:hypothetical protein